MLSGAGSCSPDLSHASFAQRREDFEGTGFCAKGDHHGVTDFILENMCMEEPSHNGGMFTLEQLRTERLGEIRRAAERRGARELRVFGSVARGEAREGSDLDLLVSWEPGRSLLDHAGLVQDLEELLGVKVHVGTEKSLHWYVRDRILREATPL